MSMSMMMMGKDRYSCSCPYSFSFSFSFPFSFSSPSPFSFPHPFPLPLPLPFSFSSIKSAQDCERLDQGKRFRDLLILPYQHCDSFFLLVHPHHESSLQHCYQKVLHRSKSTAPHSHANDDFPPILPRALSVLSFSRANPPIPLVVIGEAGPEEQTQGRGGGGEIYVGAVTCFLFFLPLVPPRAPFSLLVIVGLVKGVRPRVWTRGTRRWRTRR